MNAGGGNQLRVTGRFREAVGGEATLIERSLREGVEHAVSVSPAGKGRYIVGDAAGTSIERGSQSTFHTHPNGVALFSPEDVRVFLREENAFPADAVHRVGGEKFPISRAVDPEVPIVPVVTETTQSRLTAQFRLEGDQIIDVATGLEAQRTLVDPRNGVVANTNEEFIQAIFGTTPRRGE